MTSKYQVGQSVVVKTAEQPESSLRDAGIEPFAGETGEVTDLYWLSPQPGETFYLYTVRIGGDNRTVVLHEDELEPR